MNKKLLKITLVIISITASAFVVVQSRQQLREQQLELFTEFYGLMDTYFVDTVHLPDLMKRTMNKTLAELDRYSKYYDVEETIKRKNDWQGILYAGIGSGVIKTDSGVVITYPYNDMPAMAAGLRTGDLIMKINWKNMVKQPLDTVVKYLKGKEGDSLHITIKRPYSGTFKVGMVRKKVVDKAVPIYFIEHDSTGYIKVNHFLFGSASALKYAFSELSAMGMKKLILDLRGNIGGSVEETATALSAFLPINSLVCHIKLKDSTQNYSNLTLEQPTNTTMPIVVLTDRKTISSGEIFAGCLKDQGRAIIIGDRTYGKGFVQGTHFLKNGSSLYITKARYYTPSGNFIGDKGVEPQIVAKTSDSIPPHLLAIINSSVITNYCIKQRSTAKNESSTIDKNTYNDFVSFYLSTISTVKLPEESTLSQLQQYSSIKELKNEIDARKKSLTTVYKKEIEIELQKELLRQRYQYTTAGKIEFEHSVMYDFLVEKKFISHKSK